MTDVELCDARAESERQPVGGRRVRALFVNSGILGHRAVAGLLKEAAALVPSLDAEHINLSADLTLGDRFIRRVLGIRLAPSTGRAANLDLCRWRQELNMGWLAARRIAAAERRGAFDLLHFHTQATAYASLDRMRRTPAVVSIDATQRLASREAASALSRGTYKPNIVHDGLVFRAARAIIATSQWAGADLADLYPDCLRKLHVMPYPVNMSWCDPDWIDERRARLRATPEAPVRLLFVGGDFLRKGGADLLDAWVAGDFADRATLDLVTDWPLPPGRLPAGVQIVRHITPYTPEWIAQWRRADLFVMPTRHEAFGMVYQEAAAAGLPSIATRINAIPEIVQDGRTGLLVEPADPGGLVRAMRTLIDSADLRRQMGSDARQRAVTVAAPAVYAAKLGAIIENVVMEERQ